MMTTTKIERVPTLAPLTDAEYLVCVLLGCNMNYQQVAAICGVQPCTAKAHAANAARKIPGDLAAATRCAVWARGASRDVLEGVTIRCEVMVAAENRLSAQARQPPYPLADGAVAASA